MYNYACLLKQRKIEKERKNMCIHMHYIIKKKGGALRKEWCIYIIKKQGEKGVNTDQIIQYMYT